MKIETQRLPEGQGQCLLANLGRLLSHKNDILKEKRIAGSE
jgi:hypothetical protein